MVMTSRVGHKMKTFSNEFDIQQIAEGLGKARFEALHFLHAISRFDTIERFTFKEKLSWFEGFLKLQTDQIIEALHTFGDNPTRENAIEEE